MLGYEKNWKRALNKVEGLNEAVTRHLVAMEKWGMQQAVQNIEEKVEGVPNTIMGALN